MTDTKTTELVFLREVEDVVKVFDHGHIPSKLFEIVRTSTGEVVGGITWRYVDNE